MDEIYQLVKNRLNKLDELYQQINNIEQQQKQAIQSLQTQEQQILAQNQLNKEKCKLQEQQEEGNNIKQLENKNQFEKQQQQQLYQEKQQQQQQLLQQEQQFQEKQEIKDICEEFDYENLKQKVQSMVSRLYDEVRKSKEEEKVRTEKENWILNILKQLKDYTQDQKQILFEKSFSIMTLIHPKFKMEIEDMQVVRDDFMNNFQDLFNKFFKQYEKKYEFKSNLRYVTRNNNPTIVPDMLKYLVEFSRDIFKKFMFYHNQLQMNIRQNNQKLQLNQQNLKQKQNLMMQQHQNQKDLNQNLAVKTIQKQNEQQQTEQKSKVEEIKEQSCQQDIDQIQNEKENKNKINQDLQENLDKIEEQKQEKDYQKEQIKDSNQNTECTDKKCVEQNENVNLQQMQQQQKNQDSNQWQNQDQGQNQNEDQKDESFKQKQNQDLIQNYEQEQEQNKHQKQNDQDSQNNGKNNNQIDKQNDQDIDKNLLKFCSFQLQQGQYSYKDNNNSNNFEWISTIQTSKAQESGKVVGIKFDETDIKNFEGFQNSIKKKDITVFDFFLQQQQENAGKGDTNNNKLIKLNNVNQDKSGKFHSDKKNQILIQKNFASSNKKRDVISQSINSANKNQNDQFSKNSKVQQFSTQNSLATQSTSNNQNTNDELKMNLKKNQNLNKQSYSNNNVSTINNNNQNNNNLGKNTNKINDYNLLAKTKIVKLSNQECNSPFLTPQIDLESEKIPKDHSNEKEKDKKTELIVENQKTQAQQQQQQYQQKEINQNIKDEQKQQESQQLEQIDDLEKLNKEKIQEQNDAQKQIQSKNNSHKKLEKNQQSHKNNLKQQHQISQVEKNDGNGDFQQLQEQIKSLEINNLQKSPCSSQDTKQIQNQIQNQNLQFDIIQKDGQNSEQLKKQNMGKNQKDNLNNIKNYNNQNLSQVQKSQYGLKRNQQIFKNQEEKKLNDEFGEIKNDSQKYYLVEKNQNQNNNNINNISYYKQQILQNGDKNIQNIIGDQNQIQYQSQVDPKTENNKQIYGQDLQINQFQNKNGQILQQQWNQKNNKNNIFMDKDQLDMIQSNNLNNLKDLKNLQKNYKVKSQSQQNNIINQQNISINQIIQNKQQKQIQMGQNKIQNKEKDQLNLPQINGKNNSDQKKAQKDFISQLGKNQFYTAQRCSDTLDENDILQKYKEAQENEFGNMPKLKNGGKVVRGINNSFDFKTNGNNIINQNYGGAITQQMPIQHDYEKSRKNPEQTPNKRNQSSQLRNNLEQSNSLLYEQQLNGKQEQQKYLKHIQQQKKSQKIRQISQDQLQLHIVQQQMLKQLEYEYYKNNEQLRNLMMKNSSSSTSAQKQMYSQKRYKDEDSKLIFQLQQKSALYVLQNRSDLNSYQQSAENNQKSSQANNNLKNLYGQQSQNFVRGKYRNHSISNQITSQSQLQEHNMDNNQIFNNIMKKINSDQNQIQSINKMDRYNAGENIGSKNLQSLNYQEQYDNINKQNKININYLSNIKKNDNQHILNSNQKIIGNMQNSDGKINFYQKQGIYPDNTYSLNLNGFNDNNNTNNKQRNTQNLIARMGKNNVNSSKYSYGFVGQNKCEAQESLQNNNDNIKLKQMQNSETEQVQNTFN